MKTKNPHLVQRSTSTNKTILEQEQIRSKTLFDAENQRRIIKTMKSF